MTTLTIMRGVSGSGKSTQARMIADMTNAQIVSRDDIRMAFFGKEFDPAIEDRVSIIEQAMIEGLLRKGVDVISDNTYIEMKYVKATAKIGYRCNAEVKVVVVDEPLAVCKARNEARAFAGGRNVPNEVIEKQYSRFQGTKNQDLPGVQVIEPYTGTPGKPKAFLVDIDGTLAHMNGKRGPYDWKKVGLDDPDEIIIEIVNNLADDHTPYNVIVMSGRDESCRFETEDWLDNYIPFDHLFMRPEKDQRSDNLIKYELFNNYIRNNFDVQFVIDDREQVVRMWKMMGLKVLNVAGLDDGIF